MVSGAIRVVDLLVPRLTNHGERLRLVTGLSSGEGGRKEGVGASSVESDDVAELAVELPME